MSRLDFSCPPPHIEQTSYFDKKSSKTPEVPAKNLETKKTIFMLITTDIQPIQKQRSFVQQKPPHQSHQINPFLLFSSAFFFLFYYTNQRPTKKKTDNNPYRRRNKHENR